MREKKLPCDALIYLGTDFTPSGWNTHNGEFTWNAANFPDPKRAIEELHALHYRVVLHIVIEGRHLTGTAKDACNGAEPSGRTPDNRWPDERSVGCYWPYHKPLFDLSIDGWWPDQGDGLDAPSRLNRIRMYWEGSQVWRAGDRPFALHRNGAPGMQRYGAFLWSGDVQSTWKTLETHVPVAINTGLSGIPFWGTDIGGFIPTAEFTGELFVRWFQFGAFCPLFRSHGRHWHLHLPWGWNDGDGGPPETPVFKADPSELHNTASVHLFDRARDDGDRSADDSRALDPLSRRSPGGRARRRVPVGPRYPRGAGHREGRDGPAGLSSRRHVVRLLDRGSPERRPRNRAHDRSRDDAALRARRRAGADGTRQAVQRRARPGTSDAARVSRRGRHVRSL
ncbi:MAG: hypothetical protein DMF86_19625 [Acidobacteria bacterium]|nr:MAG: hypothetical protein DMF86_19625 [Acidobacteriota bacterium]